MHKRILLSWLAAFLILMSVPSCKTYRLEKIKFKPTANSAKFPPLKVIFDNDKLDEYFMKGVNFPYQKEAALAARDSAKRAFTYYVNNHFTETSGPKMGYVSFKINKQETKGFMAMLTCAPLLYLPQVFGAPAFTAKKTTDITIQIYDKDKKLIANYNSTGVGKSICGVGAYKGKDYMNVAQSKAIWTAFDAAKDKIMADKDKIMEKLIAKGPIKEVEKVKKDDGLIGDAQEEEEEEEDLFGKRGARSGSGFMIAAEGIVATNYHVIEDATEVELSFPVDTGFAKYKAKVLSSDKTNDIAVLRIDDPNFKPLETLPYSFLDQYGVGEKVFTIGYPQPDLMGVGYKYTSGEVNALSGMADDITLMQISVPIQPGNSGGPLFNAKGDVIGLTTSTLNPFYTAKYQGSLPQNVNYAVKVDYLKALAKQYTKDNVNTVSALPNQDMIKVLSRYTCLIKVK